MGNGSTAGGLSRLTTPTYYSGSTASDTRTCDCPTMTAFNQLIGSGTEIPWDTRPAGASSGCMVRPPVTHRPDAHMTQAQAVKGLQDNYMLLADPPSGYITTNNLMNAANGTFHGCATDAQKKQATDSAKYFLAHPYEYAALDTSRQRRDRDGCGMLTDNMISRDDLAVTAQGLAGEPVDGPGTQMTQSNAIKALQDNYGLFADTSKECISTNALMDAANGILRVGATANQKAEATAAAKYFLQHPYEYGALETAYGRSHGNGTTSLTNNGVSPRDLAAAAQAVSSSAPMQPSVPTRPAATNYRNDQAGDTGYRALLKDIFTALSAFFGGVKS